MNKLQQALLCLVFTLCVTHSRAQVKWDAAKQPTLTVDIPEGKAFRSVPVTEQGVVQVEKLPARITITLPEKNRKAIKVLINKGTNQFTIGFEGTSLAEKLTDADLALDQLDLYFHKGDLVRINDRNIPVRRVVGMPPYVQVTTTAATATPARPEEGLDTKVTQQIAANDTPELQRQLTCLLCNLSFDCPAVGIKPAAQSVRNNGTNINGEEGKVKKSSEPHPNITANFSYQEDPSVRRWFLGKRRPAPIYHAVYDDVTGSIEWYLSFKGVQTQVTDISTIRPASGSEISVLVKTKDGGEYVLTADGETYFMNDSAGFNQVLTGLLAAGQPKAADTAKGNVELSLPQQSGSESTKPKPEAIIKVESLWKAKLLALDKALEQFNTRFASIDFREKAYRDTLAMLQQNIKTCFGLSPGSDAAALAKALVHQVKYAVPPAYWTEMQLLINAIEGEYKTATGKKSTRTLVARSVQVPDADKMTLQLKGKDNKELLKREFWVRGRFKIDFSTGVFFSGLTSPDYVLARSSFRFRRSVDVVDTSTGVPINRTIFTGAIGDTSGNFIRENGNGLAYGAGFFAHWYWRDGRGVTPALTTGLALNNQGQANVMLGGSLMFKAGSQRITLSGGAAAGRVERLSASNTDYLYRDQYRPFDNGQQVYPTRNSLPVFFPESEIKKFQPWRISYFVAITYNFATVTPKVN